MPTIVLLHQFIFSFLNRQQKLVGT